MSYTGIFNPGAIESRRLGREADCNVGPTPESSERKNYSKNRPRREGAFIRFLVWRGTILHMIAHTMLLVSDYQKAKDFYTKILEPLGYTQTMEYGEAAGYNDGKNTDFWIATSEKGTIPMHIAFAAKNKKEVDEFHTAALAAGAKDNGKPGYRKDYWPGYYAAFVHDHDGHNVEVVFYDYDEK